MKKKFITIMVAVLLVAAAAFCLTACDMMNGGASGNGAGAGNGASDGPSAGHTEHEFGAWQDVIDPTCTTPGRQERYCECGEKEEETISPLGHNYEENVVDPTCTEGGYTEHVCSRCQNRYTSDETPATGHKYKDGFCERCGKEIAESEGLMFVLKEDGTYKVGGYNGSDADVVILASHEGKPVTVIGEEAFRDKESVTSVLLPEGITEIGRGAFANTYITEITFPASLCKIAQDAFSYSRLETVTFAENGSLTEIERGAFSGTYITEITFPASLRKIAQFAFSSSRLETVSFAENGALKEIGIDAFYDCYNLTEIALPEGLETLGEQAFASCGELTSLSFPASLTSIGNKQTGYCGKLASLTVAEGNPVYVAKGNCLIEKATKTLVMGCNASVIPADGSVEVLAEDAFYNCYKIKEFPIPSSVTTIEFGSLPVGDDLEYAVYEGGNYLGNADNQYMVFVSVVDKSAESIALADSMKLFAPRAFYETHVRSVEIPAGVERIGEYAFQHSALTAIEIPATVKNIGKSAFSGCQALAELSFATNSAIESIGEGAFWECWALETVTVPAGVSSVGKDAFRNCPIKTATVSALALKWMNKSTLETLEIVGGGAIEEYALSYASALTTVKIGAGVTEIDQYAFQTCDALTSIEIGADVRKIESGAFYSCGKLTDFVFAAGSKIEELDGGIFTGCEKITYREEGNARYLCSKDNDKFILVRLLDTTVTSFVVDDDTEVIYYDAFGGMNGLTSVTLPAGLRSIGHRAFCNCTALTAVDIPAGVTFIGQEAFASSGIESVVIPAGVKTLYRYAFARCRNLKSVTIAEGSALESIEYDAFYDCAELQSINVPSSLKSVGMDAFKDCGALVYSEYQNGYYLGNEENAHVMLVKIKDKNVTEFTIHEDTKIIYQGAFQYCEALAAVTIPSGVAQIGSLAFAGCSSLAEISLPEGLTALNVSVFNGCRALRSVTIPAKVEIIDMYAFSGCSNLETVIFAEGSALKSIEREAFYECAKLASFVMPSTVESIGEKAFAKCTNLKSVVFSESLASVSREEAFADCVSLESIAVEEGNEKYYADGNCLIERALGYSSGNDEVVLGCKTSVIPENAGIGYIGKNAFRGCTGLTSIVIPYDVRSIGYDAFRGCENLLSIDLPGTLSEIYNYAFEGCYKLIEIRNRSMYITLEVGSDARGEIAKYAKTVYAPQGVASKISENEDGFVLFADGDELVLVAYTGEETELVLPEGLTEINRYALRGGKFTSVTVPATVKKIGNHAFFRCRELTEIVFEQGSELAEIGIWAFCECVELPSIVIPEGVATIATNALSECDKLESVTLSNGTKIDEYAMTGLDALTEIRFLGTTAEWIDTEKGEGWDYRTEKYVVVCSDGRVDRYERVIND